MICSLRFVCDSTGDIMKTKLQLLFLFQILMSNTLGHEEILRNESVLSGKQHNLLRHVRQAQPEDECFQTSGLEVYPWWQVELPRALPVTSITLNNERDDYLLHDLRISVGNEDITQLTTDVIFEKNSICKQIDGTIGSKTKEIHCDRMISGKYVTIQIVKPCKGYGCSGRRNILRLCEIKVMGHENFVHEIHKEDRIGSRNVKGMEFALSSTTFGGKAELAWRYGQPETRRERSICPRLEEVITHHNSEEEARERAYIVTFPTTYIIQKIKFRTFRDKIEKVKFHLKMYVKMDDVALCTEYKGYISADTFYEFDCLKPVMGYTGIVQFENNQEINIFTLCPDIQFIGYKVINVAKRRPTMQSSQKEGSPHSSVAVDGLANRNMLSIPPSICMSTRDDDRLPWWRVDLLRTHVVNSLYIAGSKADKLHDLMIRVGYNDIVGMVDDDSVFEENALCKDYSGQAFYDINLYVECESEVPGRFLSIQVTNLCRDPVCSKDSSVLALCEVDVYGLPVDSYYYGNIANTVPLLKFMNFEDKENEVHTTGGRTIPKPHYNWMAVNFEDTAFLQSVILYPAAELNSSDIEIHFQIRNGFRQDVKSVGNWLWVEENDLCFEGDLIPFDIDFFEVQCEQDTMGNSILVQYNCTWTDNQTSCLDLELFTNLEAWVYKIRPKPIFAATSGEVPNDDFTYGWQTDSMDVLIADEFIAVKEYSETMNCTYTIPGEDQFPWLNIKFKMPYEISGVRIKTAEDGTHRRLHDFEIRVGYDDISKAQDDSPFTGNHLCYSSGSNALSQTNQVFECDEAIIGKFLSIQIVNNCSDYSQCDTREPNILNLCLVEVQGKVFSIEEDDLSTGRPIKQSS